MAIKINFDTLHNAEAPTFVLAKRNGDKYGALQNIKDIVIKDSMKEAPEISFTVCKEDSGTICSHWEEIQDFKLVWCREWDTWFEIVISTSDSENTLKNVSLKRLGEAELSNIMLYGIEINTENDILREDYTEPTILYHPAKPAISLLNRILEKAPHYSIRHVDASIATIQRIFTFDNKSIKSAFDEIAEELNCLFVLSSGSNADGTINRCIDVYDLYSYCRACGARGEFSGKCPECGSSDISAGFGEDTTILVSKEDLGEDITLETDTESVKNCYRLNAGDDLMTATVINCNPNGSAYLWNISDRVKSDMPNSLASKIDSYEELYRYYQKTYAPAVPAALLAKYNELVAKYKSYQDTLEQIAAPAGYPKLMEAYYNTIDLELFLKSELMPNAGLSDTSAQAQAALLTGSALSPVAVANINYLSLSSASSSVLNAARVIVDGRYQVKVKTSSLTGTTWTGSFAISNYSDEDDTAESESISVRITNDYSSYVKQKIDKALNKSAGTFAGDITAIFALSLESFQTELQKYCLDSLNTFNEACQACINVMTEQGVDQPGSELYQNLYVPYINKLEAIQAEILVRENEIAVITAPYDAAAAVGMQDFLWKLRTSIQNTLNLQNYLGNDWKLFCAYRREETYSNDNYISDGLNNAELFQRACEFIQTAENEIYKAANLQHKISAKLKNLLTIKEFEPLVEHFSCGNWIRIKIEDELYQLRLLDYEIDFNNLSDISVTFSDVIRIADGVSNITAVINKSSAIIDSYNSSLNQISKDFEYTYDIYSSAVNGYFDSAYDDYMYSIMDMGYQTYSKIDQTDSKITLQVATLNEELSSRITMTENSITSEVSRATAAEGNLSSRITQTESEISLKVNNNGIISAINLSPEEACIQSDKIRLEGYVSINHGFSIDEYGNATFENDNSRAYLSENVFRIKNLLTDQLIGISAAGIYAGLAGVFRQTVLSVDNNGIAVLKASIDCHTANINIITAEYINNGIPITSDNIDEYISDAVTATEMETAINQAGNNIVNNIRKNYVSISDINSYLTGYVTKPTFDSQLNSLFQNIASLTSRVSALENA